MTRSVYVVLSHRNWPQVRRLADAIIASSRDARVIVMHDSRHERFPTDVDAERIDVIDHGLACDWGSWELVEATLQGFAIARARYDPQLVVLISGQDYPVRSLADWEDQAIAAESWIGEAAPLAYQPAWGRANGVGDDRLTRYSYRWFRSPAEWLRPRTPAWMHLSGRAARGWARIRRALTYRLAPLLGVRYVARGRGRFYGVRRFPDPFSPSSPCWFGSQWLAVRRRELDPLLDEDLRPGARLRRVYRRSIIPDESALVTSLSNRAPHALLPPVTSVRWDEHLDTTLIRTLDDLDEILTSGSPFCRKVDPVVSAELLDELDRRLAEAQ